jgi:hypothetical protein
MKETKKTLSSLWGIKEKKKNQIDKMMKNEL